MTTMLDQPKTNEFQTRAAAEWGLASLLLGGLLVVMGMLELQINQQMYELAPIVGQRCARDHLRRHPGHMSAGRHDERQHRLCHPQPGSCYQAFPALRSWVGWPFDKYVFLALVDRNVYRSVRNIGKLRGLSLIQYVARPVGIQ